MYREEQGDTAASLDCEALCEAFVEADYWSGVSFCNLERDGEGGVELTCEMYESCK